MVAKIKIKLKKVEKMKDVILAQVNTMKLKWKIGMRKLIANFCIASLLYTPTLFAQNNVANTMVGAINQVGQQYLQMQQQSNQAMIMGNISKLGPGCVGADKKPCYITEAKYFPECKITNSLVNFPVGICTKPSINAVDVDTFTAYKNMALSWVNQFDHMLNMGQNSNQTVGLKCLEDKRLAMGAQLQNTINSLTALQTQLNKNKEVFRESNKQILSNIGDINSQLFGSNGRNVSKDKTRNISGLFSPSCQNIIGNEVLSSASEQGGLNGVFQGLVPKQREAGDFIQNRANIEQDVRNSIQKITASIKENGVSDFTNVYNPNDFAKLGGKDGGINAAVAEQANKVKVAQARIQAELSKIQPGYTLPPLDRNFSGDQQEFIANAEAHFKKEYINGCLTGASEGVALPLSKVIESLTQQNSTTRRSEKSVNAISKKYGETLERIMNNDKLSIDEKLAEIQKLDGLYQNVKVTYNDSQSQRQTKSPYELYMGLKDACEQKYSSTGSDKAFSGKQKVERAKKLLTEYKDLNDSFAMKVSESITNKLLSCNGEAKKAGNNTCGDAMKSENPNFCLAHANECANEVNACYAKAETEVKTRQESANKLAAQYNQNVADLIVKSNQLYNLQQGAVQNLVTYMQQRFPGTKFELPQDMAISAPTLTDSDLGVKLAGGGDLKFLDELPKKIDLLKQMLNSQGESTDKLFSEYIGQQRERMDLQKKRYEDLAQSCEKTADASLQQIQKINDERINEFKKRFAAKEAYCARYKRLAKSGNPLAFCGKTESLAKELGQAVQLITPGAADFGNDFVDICDQVQAEKEYGKTSKDKLEDKQTFSLCNSGYDRPQLIKSLRSKFKAQISPEVESAFNAGDFIDDKSKISEYLNAINGFKDERKPTTSSENADAATIKEKITNLKTQIKEMKEADTRAENTAAITRVGADLEQQEEKPNKLNASSNANETDNNQKKSAYGFCLKDYKKDEDKNKDDQTDKFKSYDALLKASFENADLSTYAQILQAKAGEARDIPCDANDTSSRNIGKNLLDFSSSNTNKLLGLEK